MLDHPLLIFLALIIAVFGLVSKASERSILSAPMVFVLLGLLATDFGFESFVPGVHADMVKILAEITLMLVLFNDALSIDVRDLINERKLPARLLFVGLPLTMLAGVGAGLLILSDWDVYLIILAALILSPTDAALGLPIVTSQLIPKKVRQTINVESGLNDGIALPPILIVLAIMGGAPEANENISFWLAFILKQFVLGPVAGGFIGWLGGRAITYFSNREMMSATYQRLSSVALALLSYALAEKIGGNGFIAAYFAGLSIGNTHKSIRERIHEFGEAESQMLIMIIFMLLGLVLIPATYQYWNFEIFIYALLSLTVIRLLPAYLSLRNTGLDSGTRWLIAWFGPRGIASVLYLLMAVQIIGVKENEKFVALISLTVTMSVFAHGISAMPLAKLYNRHMSKRLKDAEVSNS